MFACSDLRPGGLCRWRTTKSPCPRQGLSSLPVLCSSWRQQISRIDYGRNLFVCSLFCSHCIDHMIPSRFHHDSITIPSDSLILWFHGYFGLGGPGVERLLRLTFAPESVSSWTPRVVTAKAVSLAAEKMQTVNDRKWSLWKCQSCVVVWSLVQVIKDHLPNQGLCVVFVETKRGADALEMDLHQVKLRPSPTVSDCLRPSPTVSDRHMSHDNISDNAWCYMVSHFTAEWSASGSCKLMPSTFVGDAS
jgi:hypothetical protein